MGGVCDAGMVCSSQRAVRAVSLGSFTQEGSAIPRGRRRQMAGLPIALSLKPCTEVLNAMRGPPFSRTSAAVRERRAPPSASRSPSVGTVCPTLRLTLAQCWNGEPHPPPHARPVLERCAPPSALHPPEAPPADPGILQSSEGPMSPMWRARTMRLSRCSCQQGHAPVVGFCHGGQREHGCLWGCSLG